MKLLYGPNKFFIGIVKFFDANKDFGFIASNNCNMSVPKYNQDFYVNSSSFIEEEAKGEGRIVVFQVEKQDDGKKKAVNVRRITKSDDDINLALSYYGDHEFIELKNNQKINLYNHLYTKRKLVAEKVRSIIENDEERSPQKTAKHFELFIEHYKQDNLSKDKYVFDRDYRKDEKSIWVSLLSIFTYDERLELLKLYPSTARYFDDTNLLKEWINSCFSEDCSLSQLTSIKNNFVYLPEDCVAVAKDRIETIADGKIKSIYTELSKLNYIEKPVLSGLIMNVWSCHQYDINTKTLLEELSSYLKLTSKDYEAEKEKCYKSIRDNKFIKELNNFNNRPTDVYAQDSFTQYLNKLSVEELESYKKKVEDAVTPVLDKYIDDKQYTKASAFLNKLSMLDKDYHTKYTTILYPLVIDYFLDIFRSYKNDLNRNVHDIFVEYDSVISIFNDSEKKLISQSFIPVIKETNNIYLLSAATSSIRKWIPIDEALELAKTIVCPWTFKDINDFIQNTDIVFDNDERFVEIVIETATKLVGNVPLNHFYDGTVIGESEIPNYRNPERENCSFLKSLKVFIPNVDKSESWKRFINSRSVDDLRIMFENEVIEEVPQFVVEKIINDISLNSVSASDSRWYEKPILENQTDIKILETASISLFPSIANRLLKMDLSNDNIPLAVLLSELMTINKPEEYKDYYIYQDWNRRFRSNLESLKKTANNQRLSVILWTVHTQTTASMEVLSDMFAYMPPYIQIRCVKKLFQLINQGKIHHTANSLYSFISKGDKPICLPLEIAFSYLKRREVDPTATLDNNTMLQLLDNREDYAEWIGVRQLVSNCWGRWHTKELSRDRSNWRRNDFFNGMIEKEGEKLKVYVPNKMIDEYGTLQDYNNKYFKKVTELINISYSNTEYNVVNEPEAVSYYFDKSYETELFSIARPYNFKFNGLDNYIDFEIDKDYVEPFCECRLSDKVDNYYGIAFYWCGNKPCFRSPVRYRIDSEWEYYTILDFMRILHIPADYVNRNGKKTKFGYYTILSSYLGRFYKFYEHLKCRGCDRLMKPINISNFATRAVTEFSCQNEQCSECGKTVYLNHCFNKQDCNATIDSRDSKQCPNGQYICPECGACCSTENFRLRISNLHQTGGHISDWLTRFVDQDLGHWEKQEAFCYKCGGPMILEGNHHKCEKCGVIYTR